MLGAKNPVSRLTNSKGYLSVSAALSSTLLFTENAYAQTSAFSPLQKAVQTIIDFIVGPFGVSLAVLFIIGLGFMAAAGRLSWFTAGSVIIGIGIIFGAPQIAPDLIGAIGK